MSFRGVVFRPMAAGDLPIVLDPWSKGFRESPWAGVVPNNRWHEVLTDSVAQLLARGAQVEVAAAEHRPDQVLGWVCWEKVPGGLAVHYMYVKDPYRRRGLGTELLRRAEAHVEEAGRFYTYRTRASAWFRGWAHVPEIARRAQAGAPGGVHASVPGVARGARGVRAERGAGEGPGGPGEAGGDRVA